MDVGGLEAKVRQMYRQVAEQPQASYHTPNRQRSRASMIIINRVTARRTGRDRMIMEAPSKQVKAMRNITLIMLRMHPTPQEARATAGITPACPWMPWCATGRTVYRSLRRSPSRSKVPDRSEGDRRHFAICAGRLPRLSPPRRRLR